MSITGYEKNRHTEFEAPPSEVVPLRLDSTGTIAVASCPFPSCTSRKPSFTIFLAEGKYWCPSCGRRGGTFNLKIRWIDGLEERAWKPLRRTA